MDGPRTCPKCGKPQKSVASGSMTQWISACNCAITPVETESVAKVLTCAKCHKKIEQTRDGSFTQWIFKENRCECETPEPILSTAAEEPHGATARDILDDIAAAEDEEEELSVNPEHFPVERYKPLAILGSGAAGNVYLCRDRLLGKRVALKTLHHITAEQLMSFQHEARATSKLKHPNVVGVLDFGATKSGAPFMVMDYVEGTNLENFLKANGAMKIADALQVMQLLCHALAYAHDNQIFHRDLKPSNIILIETPDELDVRLIDFGIARVKEITQEPTIHQGVTIAGTPAYMSPDQIAGKSFDARSEVYSLGCLFFECLTGRPPFIGESSMETISMHATKSPPSLAKASGSSFPDWLERLVARCLEKDPKRRFADVNEVLNALNAAGQEREPTQALEEQPLQKRLRRRNPLLRAPSVILMLGLIIVAIYHGPTLIKQVRSSFSKPNGSASIHRNNFEEKRMGGHDWMISTHPISDDDLKELQRKNVTRLNITHTDVTGTGFRFLVGSPIKVLCLDYDPIKDESFDYINELRDLERLSCANTDVSIEAFKRLSKLSSLEVLDVRECPNVDDSCIATVSKLSSLRGLYMGPNPQLTSAALLFIPNLKQLDELDLTELSIADNQLAELSKLPLTKLFLRGCDVSDKNVLELRQCKTLKQLSLTFTPVSEKAIKELKAALPGCQIDYSKQDRDVSQVTKKLKEQQTSDPELIELLGKKDDR